MKAAKPIAPPAPLRTRSVVLGTAGHIDHGKTALVLALTGTDTDRLPEEKARGITIDLGFAALALTDVQGSRYDVSLIDVPGHHAFVRNMLAGAGGIDAVMLVIAADEGIKAQTEEHLAICTLLGIASGIVVLTKADLVSAERLQAARQEVARFTKHTFLERAPVLSVSAFTRERIPELKAALAHLVAQVPVRNTLHTTRLPVDRAFSVKGFGTVVTGTLQSGTIATEDALELLPERRSVRVRGVQVHGNARRNAQAPNRVALNLAAIDVAEIKRGDTLVLPGTLSPTSTIDAEITSLPGAPALKHRARVRLHAFTSDTLATVLHYTQDESERRAPLVRLRLSSPMVLAPGDRFVLRQPSPARTLAGGLILDAQPLPQQRKAAARAWLQRLRDAPPAHQLRLRVQRRGVTGISLKDLASEAGLTREAAHTLLQPELTAGHLIADGKSVEQAVHLLSAEALAEASARTLKELARTRANPLSRAELRSRAKLSPWVFDVAITQLQREQRIEQNPSGICLAGQKAPAASAQNGRLQQIEQLYASAGLASPIVSEAATTLGLTVAELRSSLTALLRANRLVRLGSDDLLVHIGAISRLTADLQQLRGQAFDVARFKDFTRLTRKHAIPLLEYLDGARITRNSNGSRVVL